MMRTVPAIMGQKPLCCLHQRISSMRPHDHTLCRMSIASNNERMRSLNEVATDLEDGVDAGQRVLRLARLLEPRDQAEEGRQHVLAHRAYKGRLVLHKCAEELAECRYQRRISFAAMSS